MTILDLVPGKFKRASVGNGDKGGEWCGPCPICKDGEDRFRVWPDQGVAGSFWCRICGKGGDAIEYLKLTEGLPYLAACEKLGITPAKNILDGAAPRRRVDQVREFEPASRRDPVDLWQEKGTAFVSNCHNELLKNVKQLDWLAARGIGLDMVKKYRLGWNEKNYFRARGSWGLSAERKPNNQLKKLWIPRGLIIPWFIGDILNRIRVRLPGDDPRAGDLSYLVVSGSGRSPMISRQGAAAYMTVESELDGIAIDGAAGDLVGVIAMGNSSAKPDQEIYSSLKAAIHISVALDNDPAKTNIATRRVESAGAVCSKWWIETFKQAERTPVVGGKDPGEAFKAGINLRSWVLAGLPPKFIIAARNNNDQSGQNVDQDDNSDQSGQNVGQDDNNDQSGQNVGQDDNSPRLSNCISQSGRGFGVTDSREIWKKESDAGRPVFSLGELERVKEAGGSPGENEAILDIKEVFSGCYISAARSDK